MSKTNILYLNKSPYENGKLSGEYFKNNVKIEIKHQDCVSRGSLTVIEKTGKEGPTERKTQPKERTPEDG